MNLYPLFADLEGRTVLVVGGGVVAERKIAALLKSGAKVRVVARALNVTLSAWACEAGHRLVRRRLFGRTAFRCLARHRGHRRCETQCASRARRRCARCAGQRRRRCGAVDVSCACRRRSRADRDRNFVGRCRADGRARGAPNESSRCSRSRDRSARRVARPLSARDSCRASAAQCAQAIRRGRDPRTRCRTVARVATRGGRVRTQERARRRRHGCAWRSRYWSARGLAIPVC